MTYLITRNIDDIHSVEDLEYLKEQDSWLKALLGDSKPVTCGVVTEVQS